MPTQDNKQIQIFEGINVQPWTWFTIALVDEIVKTLFSFTVGVGVTEVANGHAPLFGAFGMIILTVIKNLLNKIMEWKNKNDTPPNSINTVMTEVKPNSVTETSITETK